MPTTLRRLRAVDLPVFTDTFGPHTLPIGRARPGLRFLTVPSSLAPTARRWRGRGVRARQAGGGGQLGEALEAAGIAVLSAGSEGDVLRCAVQPEDVGAPTRAVHGVA